MSQIIQIYCVLFTISLPAGNLDQSVKDDRKRSTHTHKHTLVSCSNTADEATLVFLFFNSLFIGLNDADYASCIQNEIFVTQHLYSFTTDLCIHVLYLLCNLFHWGIHNLTVKLHWMLGILCPMQRSLKYARMHVISHAVSSPLFTLLYQYCVLYNSIQAMKQKMARKWRDLFYFRQLD